MRTRADFNLPSIVLTLALAFAASAAVGQTGSRVPLYPVSLNQKSGYIDGRGQMVIPPRFDRVSAFSEGLAAILIGSHWGYIDPSGTVVITHQYEDAGDFSEGLAAVLLDGRYGYIDRGGSLVIRPQFENAVDFSEGLARVKKDGEWSFINNSGETAFLAPFDYVDDFRGGFALVAKRFDDGTADLFAHGETKVSFIDKTGKLSAAGWLSAASRYSEGLAAVSRDENIVASVSRHELILDNFDSSLGFLKPVRYSFIDASGQKVFEGVYQVVGDFAGGLAAARVNNKWGYINKQGKLVIPPRFDGAESFSEGLALVVTGDKRYFIDASGRVVFITHYTMMTPFLNGLAKVFSCVTSPCKYGYMNKTGKIIWQGVHSEIQ